MVWCVGFVILIVGWKSEWHPITSVAAVLAAFAIALGVRGLSIRLRAAPSPGAVRGSGPRIRRLARENWTPFERLTTLLALLAFTGFGVAALYSLYQTSEARRAIAVWGNLLRTSYSVCSENPSSIYCETLEDTEQKFNAIVDKRDRSGARSESLALLSFGVPFGLAVVFFGARWVRTGRLGPPVDGRIEL